MRYRNLNYRVTWWSKHIAVVMDTLSQIANVQILHNTFTWKPQSLGPDKLQGLRFFVFTSLSAQHSKHVPRLNEAEKNNAIGRSETGGSRSLVSMTFYACQSTITSLWIRNQHNL